MECFGNEILLTKGDITLLDVDCVVNAANKTLLGGGGVDGAIHRRAGRELLAECRALRGCETGEAKITKGYNLKAKYIIHTVGPIYSGTKKDEVLLADCYKNSLDLAFARAVESVAFPCVSTGAYGYPPDEAAAVVMRTVKDWCEKHKNGRMKIIICCFDETARGHYAEYFAG